MIEIGGFLIDAALSETHSSEADVTEYPTESGSIISDHVRIHAREVTIEGLVTDTPLGTARDRRFNQQVPDENGIGFVDFLPTDEALESLEFIFKARDSVVIRTALKTYQNMVMTSLSIPVDATTGSALRFTAVFRELLTIENKRTIVAAKRSFGHRASTPLAGKTHLWRQGRVAGGDWFRNNPAIRVQMIIVNGQSEPATVDTTEYVTTTRTVGVSEGIPVAGSNPNDPNPNRSRQIITGGTVIEGFPVAAQLLTPEQKANWMRDMERDDLRYMQFQRGTLGDLQRAVANTNIYFARVQHDSVQDQLDPKNAQRRAKEREAELARRTPPFKKTSREKWDPSYIDGLPEYQHNGTLNIPSS